MIASKTFLRLCLMHTALVPAAALAQTTPAPPPTSPPAQTGATTGSTQSPEADQDTGIATPGAEDDIEISTPGGGSAPVDDMQGEEIIVRARNIPEPVRETPQVVTVLSAADIARTGDGDIAGALERVTGLSVVGNGFVYVRGLGDRYSSALLNGLPLPSPEPLRRVVPLDIFPTSVVASAVVQKSYSANFPGEFGGGVIALTTPAVPRESFLSIGASGTVDTETTAQLGYTYYGSETDWTGFDDGTRDVPGGLKAAQASGNPLNVGPNYTAGQIRDITASLVNAPTTLVQRNFDIPASGSLTINGGTSWEIGSDARFGLIATAGYSNGWRTRDVRQQVSADAQLASLQRDFRTVITDNRIVVSGLLGAGLDVGDHKLRLTGLYIRDTVKQARLAAGYNASVGGADPVENPDFFGTPPILQQNTYWFERQLINGQAVAELRFDELSVDLRGGYANSQRESPYEREFTYTYDANTARDYVNFLSRTGGQTASVAFSDLNEDLYSGGADLGYRFGGQFNLRLSGGYAYNKTERTASRYLYDYVSGTGGVPISVAQQRPDFLVSDFNVYTYDIRLSDASGSEGTPAYSAELEVHAGYGQIDAELAEGLSANAGVRYEDATQSVLPLGAGFTPTLIEENYWLPAATVTWNFANNMQLRVAASKTIARPQFRELAAQVYQDFESDRQFSGNPFLTDTELYNAEARFEWYFRRGERFSIAGFYKRLENPIEQVAFIVGGGGLRTGFANAPKADLYGGEVELLTYIPLEGLGDLFLDRRLLVSANYTYTKSKLKIDDSSVIGPDLSPVAANVLYRDGSPLTGQSDHLANLQLGIERRPGGYLSQQTLLVNYASERVTNRGPIQGTAIQPDIIERPGVELDFVAREEAPFLGATVELSLEMRNLLGRRYREFQEFDDRTVFINRYRLGRTYSLGATVKF